MARAAFVTDGATSNGARVTGLLVSGERLLFNPTIISTSSADFSRQPRSQLFNQLLRCVPDGVHAAHQ
jgi:hypothetical protein